jgi:hypothetical protein
MKMLCQKGLKRTFLMWKCISLENPKNLRHFWEWIGTIGGSWRSFHSHFARQIYAKRGELKPSLFFSHHLIQFRPVFADLKESDMMRSSQCYWVLQLVYWHTYPSYDNVLASRVVLTWTCSKTELKKIVFFSPLESFTLIGNSCALCFDKGTLGGN